MRVASRKMPSPAFAATVIAGAALCACLAVCATAFATEAGEQSAAASADDMAATIASTDTSTGSEESGESGESAASTEQVGEAELSGAAGIDISWYKGYETSTEFSIASAAELRGLSALVNGTAEAGLDPVSFEGKTITQSNGIDLRTGSESTGWTYCEFTPIGTQEHPFAGTYAGAGGGVEIIGLYVSKQSSYAGLFGCCSASSRIQNIQVKAGTAGAVDGTSDTTEGGVFVTTSTDLVRNVGSIAGYTAGSIEACTSNLTVKIASTGERICTATEDYAVRFAGGIAGYVLGDVTGCGFEGLLDVGVAANAAHPDTSSESLRVADSFGGVVGRLGDPDVHGCISNCYNEGTVYTHSTGAGETDRFGTTTWARIFFVGGIVGYSNGSIYNSHNGTFNSLAGISTGLVSTSTVDGPSIEATAQLNNRGADQTGGICGGLRAVSDDPDKYNDGDPNDPMVVQNCANEGQVVGCCASGGIVGEMGVYCTVTQCRNGVADDTTQTAGKLISTRWNKPFGAGIVGQLHGSCVSYCANYAEIRNIQTGYYMAGIVGANFVSDDYPDAVPEVYACLNTGGIYTINQSKETEYREAGLVGQNEGYVHDCLSVEGSVPYHGDALIGANDWGLWKNLAVWTKTDMRTAAASAYLNAEVAQSQDWSGAYWFTNGSGTLPTLNTWANLSAEQRTELSAANVASVVCEKDAPYTGSTGSLPTLRVTLADGTELVQNADFYVVPQADAKDMTPDSKPYKAGIVGLGRYSGSYANCGNYGIGAGSLDDANMAVETMSYNGGKVVLPGSIAVYIAGSEIDASLYDYVIYSHHVDNTLVQQEGSGCTAAFDSLGSIAYETDGYEAKTPVAEVGIAAINAETRAFRLYDRKGELISDSTGAVYYTTTSGGGTPGAKYGDDEACVRKRTGMPSGYVVKATPKEGSSLLTGSVIGNYVVDTIDLYRECTFVSATMQGKTWYWDADNAEFYEVDEHGQRIEGMPAATFTGEELVFEDGERTGADARPITLTYQLADGSTYSMVEGVDYKFVQGDPDATEDYKNRNVTDYAADPKKRAAVTIRPVDTTRYNNYIVTYFAIAPAALESCTASVSADRWAYTGSEIKPPVTVTLHGQTLIEGVDYTVAYSNNVAKGTASYTVTALTNLSGGSKQSISGTFDIVDGGNVADLSIDEVGDQQYNYGYDVHPTLVFRRNGQVVNMTEGTDYTVSYSTVDVTRSSGKNPDGTAIDYDNGDCVATITGIGMYTGTTQVSFDIVPYDATANTTNQLRATVQSIARDSWKDESTLPYNMGLKNPVINVKAYPIVDWDAYYAKDYDNAYGTAILIGNANNANNGSTINNRPVRYYAVPVDGSDRSPVVVSCDGSAIRDPYETGQGTELSTHTAPANFSLYATVALRVSGNNPSAKHNGAVGYLRTESFTCAGEKTSIAAASVSVDDQLWTGEALEPEPDVSLDGTVLLRGIDYTLSYANNVEAGTATVTISGIGSYEGTAQANFTIRMPARQTERMGGAGRADTMKLIVDEAYPAGTTCDSVILATQENYPDALAANALAGVLDCPVITTEQAALTAQARELITRLQPATVYILGGTAAVSQDVENSVRALAGVQTVTRLKGDSRYQTAVAVYEAGKGSWGTTAVLAYGGNYPDALAVGSAAFSMRYPIFLVEGDALSAEVATALATGGFERVLITGGTNAVSAGIEEQAKALVGTVVRKGGAGRLQTAQYIAQWAIDELGMDVTDVCVANAGNYPDALAGGPLAGRSNSVTLLASDSDESNACLDAVLASRTERVDTCFVLGGTAAVSSNVEAHLRSLLGR